MRFLIGYEEGKTTWGDATSSLASAIHAAVAAATAELRAKLERAEMKRDHYKEMALDKWGATMICQNAATAKVQAVRRNLATLRAAMEEETCSERCAKALAQTEPPPHDDAQGGD